MLRLSITMTIVLLAGCLLLITACSNSQKGMNSPVDTDISSLDIPVSVESENHQGRSLIAMFEVVIDPDNETFTVTPSQRDAMTHVPLSNMYPNCFQIVDSGFTPNFWADIKLTHPMPGSGVDAFDPRVIAILPANPGVRFIYPSLYIGGNNRVVLEPDGYTKLFDDPSVLGNVNPFIAYFKDEPYRRWSSTEETEETKRWQMDLDGFGGPMQFKFVVDVSTNFPAPPMPVTDNAPEPVAIEALIGGGLTPDGGSADITVTLLDWQGISSIGGVSVEAPALFNGTVNLAYAGEGQNPNEYMASGTLNNTKLATVGEYRAMIGAIDQETNIAMYKEFPVIVHEKGHLIWAKRAGGTDNERGLAITTLSDDSTVVTGWFEGTAILGEGEPNETSLTSDGGYDIFIARYNPNDTLAWAKRAGGELENFGNAITTLSDNSTVVTGSFVGTAIFGPGEPAETVLTSAGGLDLFIARYNPDSTLAWAKSAGGSYWDSGNGITTLSDNSTVVTGYFQGTATFGPGESNETILVSAGGLDLFIARYNPDSTLAWAKRAGGELGNFGNAITTLSDNSTVATGWFEGTAIFGPGEPNETVLESDGGYDIFIARYNPNGTLQWAKRAGGSSQDIGYGITTLSDDSTVVTGSFKGTATFGEGEPNETELISAGGHEIFIARYNPDGTLAWAKRAGGSSQDIGYGITTLSDNSTVVTGHFESTATFGQGEPNETELISAGDMDIFIARFEP